MADIPATTRKDLYAAHQLAAEKHDLDYFKQILKSFMEQRAAELQAKEAAKAAKKATKSKKQSKAAVQEDGDAEMADAPAEAESEEAEAGGDKPKKGKKRKAEEDGMVWLNLPNKTSRTANRITDRFCEKAQDCFEIDEHTEIYFHPKNSKGSVGI